MTEDVYQRLAEHLATLGMGYQTTEELGEILRANFTPAEAEVALMLPTRVAPLQAVGVDEISAKVALPREELASILEGLAQRGLLFSGRTKDGEKGYALVQANYGFPQTFFWGGEESQQAKNMVNIVGRYLNRDVITQSAGGSETKAFRYIPVGESIDQEMQAVYTYNMMEKVIEKTRVIAVAHCPCRVTARLRGRGCDHPLEVCLKYDELAEYLIERGLGREITKEEALQIIKQSEAAGLVHMVDNAMADIKHTCNCCGCVCFVLANLKRRKIPRDVLMASYYVRDTDEDECIGCGTCVEWCPVDALTMQGDFPAVDDDWCIGCGVCVQQCSNSAAKLKLRTDKVPPRNFGELHERILEEKGLK